jgi:hypothetical protein
MGETTPYTRDVENLLFEDFESRFAASAGHA